MLNTKAKKLILIVWATVFDVLINQFAWLREYQAITVYSAVPKVTMFGGDESVAARGQSASPARVAMTVRQAAKLS